MRIVKALVAGVGYALFMAALLLVPAGLVPGGTWVWPTAWAFLIAYGSISAAASVALAIWRPANFDVRMQGLVASKDKKQPWLDAFGTVVFAVFLFGWVAFMPLDVFWLRLLPAPSGAVQIAGGIACVAGCLIACLAVAQNQFAAPTVQDQTASGQTVVDTGVYGVIRHPLYAGNLLCWAGIPLWLGSTAGFVGILGLVLFTIARIAVEEADLRKRLPGYEAYSRRVRGRVIPYVL